jgi:hypothetical protein
MQLGGMTHAPATHVPEPLQLVPLVHGAAESTPASTGLDPLPEPVPVPELDPEPLLDPDPELDPEPDPVPDPDPEPVLDPDPEPVLEPDPVPVPGCDPVSARCVASTPAPASACDRSIVPKPPMS